MDAPEAKNPSESASTDGDPLVGRVLDGRYRLEQRIGKGGMGQVYAAWQVALGRKVAVKLLFQDLSSDPDFRARFEREAMALARLNHEHVVHAYDHGLTEDGRLYLVTELLTGQPLHHLIAAQPERQMAAAPAVAILAQVSAALEAIHGFVVHRDLKPHNIIVSSQAGGVHAKLLDFGIVRPLEGSDLTSASVMGTPAYMSPEQIQQDPTLDARSDLYALGAMAFELLTGRPPFVFDRQLEVLTAHITNPAPRVDALRGGPGLPAALVDLVAQLLEKERERRPQTALEVRTRLAAISAGLDGPPTLSIAARLDAGARRITSSPVSRPSARWTGGGTSAEHRLRAPAPSWPIAARLAVAVSVAAGFTGLGAAGWMLLEEQPLALVEPVKREPPVATEPAPVGLVAELEFVGPQPAVEPAEMSSEAPSLERPAMPAPKAPSPAEPPPKKSPSATLRVRTKVERPPLPKPEAPKSTDPKMAPVSAPAPLTVEVQKPRLPPLQEAPVSPAPAPAEPPAPEPLPKIDLSVGYVTLSALTPTGLEPMIEVLHDGKIIGRGVKVKVTLPPGKHALIVRKAHQPTNARTRPVTVRGGATVSARVLLD